MQFSWRKWHKLRYSQSPAVMLRKKCLWISLSLTLRFSLTVLQGHLISQRNIWKIISNNMGSQMLKFKMIHSNICIKSWHTKNNPVNNVQNVLHLRHFGCDKQMRWDDVCREGGTVKMQALIQLQSWTHTHTHTAPSSQQHKLTTHWKIVHETLFIYWFFRWRLSFILALMSFQPIHFFHLYDTKEDFFSKVYCLLCTMKGHWNSQASKMMQKHN